jgi:hypothetical protein
MMFGEIKYIGKSKMYDFYYDGKCVKFLRDQMYVRLPIQNCRELVQNSNFVPSPETYRILKSFYFSNPDTKIEKMLRGKNCVIIGGGSSLTDFDFSKLDNTFTIAINNSIFYYPKASFCIFIDRKFLKQNDRESIHFLKKYKGLIFSAFRTKYFLESPRGSNICNFSLNDIKPQDNFYGGLYHSRSSGLAAINLALMMQPKKIYLLGYDYDYDAITKHFYNKPGEDKYENENAYIKKRCHFVTRLYNKFKKWDDRIINCNLKSNIDAFPKKSLKEVFG